MSLYAFLAFTVLIEELYVRAHLSNSSKIYALFFYDFLTVIFLLQYCFPSDLFCCCISINTSATTI